MRAGHRQTHANMAVQRWRGISRGVIESGCAYGLSGSVSFRCIASGSPRLQFCAGEKALGLAGQPVEAIRKWRHRQKRYRRWCVAAGKIAASQSGAIAENHYRRW